MITFIWINHYPFLHSTKLDYILLWDLLVGLCFLYKSILPVLPGLISLTLTDSMAYIVGVKIVRTTIMSLMTNISCGACVNMAVFSHFHSQQVCKSHYCYLSLSGLWGGKEREKGESLTSQHVWIPTDWCLWQFYTVC